MGLLNWLKGTERIEAAPPPPKPTSTAVRPIFSAFGFDSLGGGNAYNAASFGRRRGPHGSILGPNLITLESWQKLIRTSRHQIRNSPLASSAIQKFESNMVGTGIQPHFTHPEPAVKLAIQEAWDSWVKVADHQDQLSFYGLQAMVARQLFEAGEVFCRYHVVDNDDTYFQLQLIETEQVPVYYNAPGGIYGKDDIRMGILFDPATDKRVGYRMYQRQPYDNIGYSISSSQFINVPTDEMIHVMKPLRPGDYRGTPIMAPVLTLLDDIEGYADAERLRKRLAAMFAFFITKPVTEDQPIPLNENAAPTDPGVGFSNLEPGSAQVLLPGEDIVAPPVPESGDYATFMYEEIHKFAAAVGLTYEMVSGNMRGVNYSSARVALLEFRHAAEQFQRHILINQFCEKVLRRWMKEAVLSGALELPADYVTNPKQYEACTWVTDGWNWMDPMKEVQAAQMAVRSGFTSRSYVIRQNGLDPETVDAEIAAERKREQELGIITDTNSNVVLIGKETQPLKLTEAVPDDEAEEEAEDDANN